MADISMCSGSGCSLRTRCYRFTATPNEFRQSYFMNVPLHLDGRTCHEFYNNEGYHVPFIPHPDVAHGNLSANMTPCKETPFRA